jgi:hypothetical protein
MRKVIASVGPASGDLRPAAADGSHRPTGTAVLRFPHVKILRFPHVKI